VDNSKKQLRGFANLNQRKNINKNGRPRSGRALTDITRKILSGINPETGISYQAELVKKALDLALNGDVVMLKFLWEQMDGKAVQTVVANLSRGLEDVSDEELNQALHDFVR